MDVILSDFGWVRFFQPKKGYRFSTEPFVLVSTLSVFYSPKVVVDFGSGCGVIAVLLSKCLPRDSLILAVETNPDFIGIINMNLAENNVYNVRIVKSLNEVETNAVDLVVTNPPYFTESGYRSSGKFYGEKFEKLSFMDMIYLFRRILKTKGWLKFSHHPTRLAEVVVVLSDAGFGMKRLIPVYGSQGKSASYVVIDAQFGTSHYVNVESAVYLDSRDFTAFDICSPVSP